MAKKLMLILTLAGTICLSGILLSGCGKETSDKEKDSAEGSGPDRTSATQSLGKEDTGIITSDPEKEEQVNEEGQAMDEGQAKDEDQAKDEAQLTVKEFIPSSENVKLVGRTYLLGEKLWLSYSASGIEFTFTGTKADITLIGDNMSIGIEDIHYCRVGILVNGELVYDDRVTEFEKTVTVFESDKEETVTIKVLKLSEVTDSTVGIGKIRVTSKAPIQPTSAKGHTIEFIGDSITCGFGVDAADANAEYTTATEDASKAYAYKTAEALNADYSLVSISGYGIISGYTGNGIINPDQVIPPYYENMGFSYGYFNRTIRVPSISWDFNSFRPELIVINLGTNDSSYCGSDPERQKIFREGYVTFLKQVRAKNPDSEILCTLGIMGGTLYPSVEEAVRLYSEETKDLKIHAMKFDEQQASDGFGACWHPSETTHDKATQKLTKEIKALLGW